MHPLLALLVTRPQLLLDHTLAYAALFNEELSQAYGGWHRKILLQLAALCCLGVAGVLAGVAVMLWAVMPAPLVHAPWVLWATPLLPLCLALGCLWRTRGLTTDEIFAKLKRQLSADMAMLHAVSPP
jgi:hypothetical protein